MKVFACHLLNDYSGSPKVLMQLIKAWKKKGINVTVLTCSGRTGFLSNLENIDYNFYWYKWSSNSVLRLINFTISQVFLFMKILRFAKKTDVIYVNTVLPFGAGLAGKLKGCKVIYHIHETTVNPKILKNFLFMVVKTCAADVIYVSNYLSQQEHLKTTKNHILYNAISNDFYDTATSAIQRESSYKNVLMISSLKIYKGVFDFIDLASLNPHFQFRLVVNASKEEIDLFFSNTQIPMNVQLFETQTNTHPFYQWADIVLNLSHPSGWVETFGLTALEAMVYKLPTIVPPVGGITELVEDGVNGYLVDSTNTAELSEKLNKILKNKELYSQMQMNAFCKIDVFRENAFVEKSLDILNLQ